MISISDIRGAVARGWCADANRNKEMDSDLADAISRELGAIVPLSCWQTIDTAPTGDDDFFLVCCDDPADDRSPFVVRGSIFKSARQARTPGHLSLHHLTHWQPLPAKPKR